MVDARTSSETCATRAWKIGMVISSVATSVGAAGMITNAAVAQPSMLLGATAVGLTLVGVLVFTVCVIRASADC